MKRIVLTLFVLCSIVLASPINNIPDHVLTPSYEALEAAKEFRRAETSSTLMSSFGTEIDRAYSFQEVRPMECMAFRINLASETIDAVYNDYELSAAAWEAVELVPNWLKPDLVSNFRELAVSGLDEPYAQVIIDAPENIRDEVAFQYAHISRAGQTNSRFTSDYMLPVRIAELIYIQADSLEYVRIIENDETYENRFTTLEYRVVEEEDTIWVEMPRDIYYWYVVHPKLSDEGVYSSDNTSSAQQRTYDYFWREFLWFNPHPDFDYQMLDDSIHYPLLSDRLKICPVLWDRVPAGWSASEVPLQAAGAAGVWVASMMPGHPEGNRPIQPNQCAIWHRGNCGEGQDILGGTMRTGLIGGQLVCNIAEDHVWNEFWDDGWKFCQVDNYGGGTALDAGWAGYDRDHGGSKDISTVWGYRGDGYLIQCTERYSAVCTVTITVEDSDGNPVDGAYILVANESFYDETSLTYSTLIWTDCNGEAILQCGDAQNYYIRVETAFGNYPPGDDFVVNLVAEDTEAGLRYSANVEIGGAPYTFYEPNPVEADSNESFVYLSMEVTDVICGRNEALDSQNSQFRYENGDGKIRAFITDSLGFSRYNRGLSFDAYEYNEPVSSGHFELSLPSSADIWYLVLANADCFTNHQKVEARAMLMNGTREEITEAQPEIADITFAGNDIHLSGFSGTLNGNLAIYDISGRCISTLASGNIGVGSYQFSGQVNGIYLAVLRTEAGVVSRRIAFVK